MKPPNAYIKICSDPKIKISSTWRTLIPIVMSFIRLLPPPKKIIPGLKCSISVVQCQRVPYQTLQGFLWSVVLHIWTDDIVRCPNGRTNMEACCFYLFSRVVIAFDVISESLWLFYVT